MKPTDENSLQNTSGNIISNAFTYWANKRWFQAAVVVWVFLMPLLSIGAPILSIMINKQQTREVVTSTIETKSIDKEKIHMKNFEDSKHIYSLAKKELRESLDKVECEYAFLVEYHNGTENIMTGIQFCKFDITLEVCGDGCPFVNMEKFRNENISKYDILLSDELNNNRLMFYSISSIETIDKYFALQLNCIDAESVAFINMFNDDNKVFGTLIFVSTNEDMNQPEIYNTTRKIEKMFNSIKKR